MLPIPATFQQPRLAQAAALAPGRPASAGRAVPSALTGLTGAAVPLGLGLTGAFPLTLLQLRLRRRLAGTLRRGRLGHRHPGRDRPGPG